MFHSFLKVSTPIKALLIILLYAFVTALYWIVKPFPQGLYVIPLFLVSISFPWKYAWPILPITILMGLAKPFLLNLQPLPVIVQNYVIVGIVFTLLYTIGAKLKIAYDELDRTKEELSLLYQKEQELSNIDFLTGLGNHRFFQQTLLREIKSAEANNKSLGLILFDIDNFKNFNDSFGHQAGDLILKNIASTIKKKIRETDIACRYGGEEFVIIMPNSTLEEAREIGERIRASIAEETLLPLGNQGTKVTVSGGCSSYPVEATTPRDLIKMADERLYKVKRSTKNNVA